MCLICQVRGKTLDQVTDMMVANSSNLIITVKPVNQNTCLAPRSTSNSANSSHHSQHGKQKDSSDDAPIREYTNEFSTLYSLWLRLGELFPSVFLCNNVTYRLWWYSQTFDDYFDYGDTWCVCVFLFVCMTYFCLNFRCISFQQWTSFSMSMVLSIREIIMIRLTLWSIVILLLLLLLSYLHNLAYHMGRWFLWQVKFWH